MDDFDFLDAIAENSAGYGMAGDSAVSLDSAANDPLLEGLNSEQYEAVLHDKGPLLILAGAGSGKTRVITLRIAYLLQRRGVRPNSILAITFTNKAAAEMKERVYQLVGDMVSRMWIGTFHSMFARLLRRHADLLGFEKNFNILDTDDQVKIVKSCISEMDLNDKVFVPRNVLSAISKEKNEMVSPEVFAKDAGHDFHRQKIAVIYRKYQEKLRQANALDFDDILFFGVKLFSENPELLEYYQELFRYILVDEYQDTNHAQYQFIQMLARRYQNLCVVGDDDQSIYSFRGANIRNILNFEKDFKDTKIIKLEQNYRSTGNVLGAANSIIRNNSGRKDKKLWTQTKPGDKITYYSADHHGAEAYFLVNNIQRYVREGHGKYSDFAVLYRLNALSRTVESALREQGIPYRIYGGFRFYDRKEIKDVLAYLRLIASSMDNYAFERIVNVPRRGLGDTTIAKVLEIAASEGMSCLMVCAKADSFPVLARAAARLREFAELIQDFRMKLAEGAMSFAEFIEYVQDQSGLVQEIIEQQEKKSEAVDRIEILKELLSEAVEFENRRKSDAQTAQEESEFADIYDEADMAYGTDLAGILQAYLENAALYSEGDNEDKDEDFVRLLTIHSAKGLEFPVVFVIGVEEGLFPGSRSMDSETAMEEERRLAYVAVTRARRKLFITTSRSRMLFGQTQQLAPSRFVKEIDPQFMDVIGAARHAFSDSGEDMSRGQVRSYDTTNRSAGAAGRSGAAYSGSRPSPGGGFSGSGSGTVASGGTVVQSGGQSDVSVLRPDDVKKDMRIRHPRFGAGKVVSVEQVAGDALISVLFDNQTRKNMLVKSAKLTLDT